jgi:hypothetical protein
VSADDIDIQVENTDPHVERKEIEATPAMSAGVLELALQNIDTTENGDWTRWFIGTRATTTGAAGVDRRFAHDLLVAQANPTPATEAIEVHNNGIRVASTPAASSRRKNTLYSKNTPKAWGSFYWDGANIHVIDTFGIGPQPTGIVRIAPCNYRVTFEVPLAGPGPGNEGDWMDDANYIVVFGNETSAPTFPQLATLIRGSKTKQKFEIQVVSFVAGAWTLDPLIVNEIIEFVVFGAP